jgi:hypothetical protein
MDFEDQITLLADKVRNQHEVTHTEEATKTAFVMPFISRVLGYDVFNPVEVIPEYTADYGMKRGEKVDYAIMRDGEVQILIECKTFGDSLDISTASQLYRYFSVTNARIAILTNGATYKIYTDLDSRNQMDNKPYLVLDLQHVDETLLPEFGKARQGRIRSGLGPQCSRRTEVCRIDQTRYCDRIPGSERRFRQIVRFAYL